MGLTSFFCPSLSASDFFLVIRGHTDYSARVERILMIVLTDPHEILIPMRCWKKLGPLTRPHARARKIRITRKADFGQFEPFLAQICFKFFIGKFSILLGKCSHVQNESARIRNQLITYFVFITLCFVFCDSFLCISILYFCILCFMVCNAPLGRDCLQED